MDFEDAFRRAREETQVHRSRRNPLYTFGSTRLPYVCLSAEPTGGSRVLVRRGTITADRPRIAFPGQESTFEGFHAEENEEEGMVSVLIARRVELPVANYVNDKERDRTEAGPLEAAVERTVEALEAEHDSRTAVLQAPDDLWTLALLLYVGAQITRSAPHNVQEQMEHWLRRQDLL